MKQKLCLTFILISILLFPRGNIFARIYPINFIYALKFLKGKIYFPEVPFIGIISNEFKYDGSSFASGVYFYALITNDFTETKKLILLK